MTKQKPILRDLTFFFLILGTAFLLGMLLVSISQAQAPVSIIFVLAVFLISLLTQGYLWGVLASFPVFLFTTMYSPSLILPSIS